MVNPLPDLKQTASARGLFWASIAFYVLIAFEFFYMASPFAAYFYAVYGPGLDRLQQFGLSGWLLWFFLPHVVAETRSSFINNAQIAGGVLFITGLAGFAIAAFQVYRAKLRKSDAVTVGLYRHVRHPQYVSLMVASLGMLLIWPRFLVLFSTIAVIFAYTFLARIEEAICARNYPGYQEYMTRTGGFLPRRWSPFRFPHIKSKSLRVLSRAAMVITVTVLSTLLAFGVRTWTMSSLYTFKSAEGVYLSVVAIPEAELSSIANIARAAPEARRTIEVLQPGDKILAYVLPTEMYVSEIPMHLPEGQSFGHTIPKNRDHHRFKVVFTRAVFSEAGSPVKSDVISSAVNKVPLIEVHIDLRSKTVEATYPPPAQAFYPDVQVPIF